MCAEDRCNPGHYRSELTTVSEPQDGNMIDHGTLMDIWEMWLLSSFVYWLLLL